MNTASAIDKNAVARRLLFLYFLFLAADLLFVALGKDHWRFFSKFLLMPLLAGYFLYAVNEKGLIKWIIPSLFFSWAGDMLLQFESSGKIFFLSGLSLFLLAHICYIIFFHTIRMKEQLASRWWLIIPVAIYYLGLILLLSPHLGEMKLPVRVYGIVISMMLLLALHTLFMKDKPTGKLLTAGAILFIISDSILAINKFYQPFQYAGVIIMLTYGLAQAMLIIGAGRYKQ